MLLKLHPDQEFFRDTTARFLAEQVPVERVRALRDDPAGYDAAYWRRGADLGWMSLLVDEDHGGGSIGEHGLVDLSLVAYEFGRRAAPGPLVPTNVVAAALSDRPGEATAGVLGELMTGEAAAAWCYEEPRPHDRLGDVTLTATVERDEVVLAGAKRPVEAGQTATHLLVVARTGSGLTQVLVPADAPGVQITPLKTFELTKRYASIDFDGVRLPVSAIVGEAGGADADVQLALHRSLVLTCAESVGSLQVAFDLTVEWAFNRYSFGRPLASYQELKHRFADMKSWLEASHALSDEATAAVATGAPEAAVLVSAAKAFIGDHGSELVQDCVQMHGGIGVTFDHDLHLYQRRVIANRAAYGPPTEHRQRITAILERAQEAAA